ncbi:hypothetical protein QBC34DRAFT_306591 [Podospora aff. communis PSN243]|uniref:Uncharacterized protein n=1 Tax=Podospora aff. communis PSN243 TaxID=3040156 RepID=A0AAV9GBP4_9PEZI|nr:hypothetical protein QBC34DRAFT_306591 [Podospora aff. communis PSN243]
MGAAISRCTNRNTAPGVTASLSDIGQKILDNQPNWLSTPARWRPKTCNHNPIRYRTPTPYPKDDRQRMPDPPQTAASHAQPEVSEKPIVIETYTSTRHIEVIEPPKRNRHPLSIPSPPEMQLPPAALTITFERHPRRNRFERIS